jgi:hypothetical protein
MTGSRGSAPTAAEGSVHGADWGVPNEEVAMPVPPATRSGHALLRRGRSALARRRALLQETAEAGMSTAEYAVGTVAACAFAAVLYRVVTGGSVVTGLTELVESALATLS